MNDPQHAGGVLAAFFAIYLIMLIVIAVIIIIPFWFILKKAGFSSWLSLINLVPFGTLILLYVLAFAEWKVIPAQAVTWQPPLPPQI